MVTTGAIRCAELQSNLTTNKTSFLQIPTNGVKALKGNDYKHTR